MSQTLSSFCVTGLHNSRTIDVRLEDGRLVLIGENGTGKSTFANLIYFFLTKQWNRLREYTFVRISARLGNIDLDLTPEHLREHVEARHSLRALSRLRHLGSRSSAAMLEHLLERAVYETEENLADMARRIAMEAHMPRSMAEEFINELRSEAKRKPTHVQELERQISELVVGQFLYLPTYRRIEQDLRAIFRGVEIETEIRKFRERLSGRAGAPFIELVEFGMEDVEQTISTRMAAIKESVRNGLDNLTGTYLRDVIRDVHTTVDIHRIGAIDPKSLDAVFARIDEATLPNQDKKRLREKMASISSAQRIDEGDKVIAHFLSKLLEFYAEQQTRERNVREFVRICNEYLTGKQLVWDNTKYTIFIAQTPEPSGHAETLEMKSLSSGEKQIVSLFSHIYLSGVSQFFVIIDEPELSLSVPWQRKFLPDILGTGMCTGLVAVTHSPFIWDNGTEPYVKPIAEFTSMYSERPQLPFAN
jgi:energy-coupling factor transporter ATP-binding protein EcfA2